MDRDEAELPLRDSDFADMRRIALLRQRRPEHFRPWENVRPLGHRLDQAILELVHPALHWTVQQLLADEEVGYFERSAGFRDHLWRHVLWRMRHAELFLRGEEVGSGANMICRPTMFDDAVPDFGLNRITCIGRTYGAVRVFETSRVSAAPVIVSDSKQSGRLDYQKFDASLVEEMARLISTGEARGPMDAADQVASKAAGSGKHASKRARLLKRWEDRRTNSTHA